MNWNYMKSTVSVVAALLLFVIAPAAQGLPNFSGTWKMDPAKSDFGPMPAPESIVMVIDHAEPSLKVAATQKGPMGDASNNSIYTTDGKENLNKARGPAGEQDVKSTTKWAGSTLQTKRTLEAQGMSIDIDETMELAADGKTLTMTRQINTPQGSFTSKAVFTKQ